MIEIVRFDHISIAVPDRDRQVDLLERLFGFRLTRTFENEEGYLGAALEVPGRSDLYWEVLQPNGPDSYLHRFLNGPHGPGLHHVAIQVRSARQATEAIREAGIEPWGFREPEPGDDDGSSAVYIHPRSGGHGFLYQFLEFPEDLEATDTHEIDPPVDEPERWAASTYPPHEDIFANPGLDGAPEPYAFRPTLGIIAVDHLAHACEDRDELGDWYAELFGMTTIYRSEGDDAARGFETHVLDTPTGQLHFEMIAPAGEDSFIARFLERRGGASMHHVTFEVGDWHRAVEACAFHQVPIFGERSGDTNGVPWREAFIHPRDTGGMLVQFFWQAEPGAWV